MRIPTRRGGWGGTSGIIIIVGRSKSEEENRGNGQRKSGEFEVRGPFGQWKDGKTRVRAIEVRRSGRNIGVTSAKFAASGGVR